MADIASVLRTVGPSRSSKIVKFLEEREGISAINARKKISRAGGQVLKFPISLLPNREAFIYLLEQRKTEQFWTNFLEGLREANSVYGFAIDSLIARGGITTLEDFAVISGAPFALKGQVSSERVLKTLEAAGVLAKAEIDNKECVMVCRHELIVPDYAGFKARKITESIILEALRDWSRKMGLASYNSIAIRGDGTNRRMIGAFPWDLTGPSYLLPLRGDQSKPGFLVADVFSEGTMDEHSIKYIIRKSQLLRASLTGTRFLPMLIADSFTGSALTKGRSEGIVLVTPETLFGATVAKGLKNLLETLKNAAAIAAANPDRLLKLIDQLKDIEGSAGNLRGILFELISAYLAKIQGGSIEIGVKAKDPKTGKEADIDVLRVPSRGECVAIECKGKIPGGHVSKEEVDDWLGRIPTFVGHLRGDKRFAEAQLTFELWTSGSFAPEALDLLVAEKKARTKNRIEWKDGGEVFYISKTAKEKTINKALREHFLLHPLSKPL